jgi:hypothetical protein
MTSDGYGDWFYISAFETKISEASGIIRGIPDGRYENPVWI